MTESSAILKRPEMQSRVAVLMSCYNPGPELVETLNSLRQQSLPFKLFIVDDGSAAPPDYAALLAGLDHDLTLSPRNLGVNEARNPGLRKILDAGFDYIAIIDCGDIALPERLERQAEVLEELPGIGVLGSHIELRLLNAGDQRTTTQIMKFPLSPAACKAKLWSNMPVSHPAMMVRRNVYETVGLYANTYQAAEDFDFLWRAASAGFQIANVDEVLLVKQETSASVSIKRRQTQVKSRLRILWANRQLAQIGCIMGLVRTAIVAAAPQALVSRVKRMMG